jgi:hypothetical protein
MGKKTGSGLVKIAQVERNRFDCDGADRAGHASGGGGIL